VQLCLNFNLWLHCVGTVERLCWLLFYSKSSCKLSWCLLAISRDAHCDCNELCCWISIPRYSIDHCSSRISSWHLCTTLVLWLGVQYCFFHLIYFNILFCSQKDSKDEEAQKVDEKEEEQRAKEVMYNVKGHLHTHSHSTMAHVWFSSLGSALALNY